MFNTNVTNRGVFNQKSCTLFSEIQPYNGITIATVSSKNGVPESDPDAPPYKSSNNYWWNVIQFACGTRMTQIANSPFDHTGKLYIRVKHDSTWYDWAELIDVTNKGFLTYNYSSTLFDFNSVDLKAGCYRLGNNDHVLNAPTERALYGNVLVVKDNSADTQSMLLFPYGDNGELYFKSGNKVNFATNSWYKIQGTKLS